LAVKPNNNDKNNNRDAIFGMAKAASGDDKEQIRRKITMVRHCCCLVVGPGGTKSKPAEAATRRTASLIVSGSSRWLHVYYLFRQYKGGFTVDDGPYRRLDDPANSEFLMALASGRTPPELAAADTVVGLIDKRGEEYVETFQSFSGAGASLGNNNNTSETPTGVVFQPSSATAPDTAAASSDTRIAVRLPNGTRRIVQLNSTTNTVADLAAQLPADGPFRLVSGFPPQPLLDASLTIAAAGLKGAQVSMQLADE
jgi:SEP domain/UBX domain